MPPVNRALAVAAGLLLVLAPGVSRAGAKLSAADVHGADSLAAQASGRERDQALERWAERASLPELMFVLRRPPAALGAAEIPLVEAALRHAPARRTALRNRLSVRLTAAASGKGDRAWRALASEAARLPLRPRASVFQVAVLLPDTGDYQSFGAAVRLGIEVGLAQHAARTALAPTIVFVPTGDESVERVADGFDRAAEASGVIIGGLLSAPTATLATAARLTGLPLLSPTATDEAIGAIGPQVFQVGPSGRQRGQALARAVLASGPRRVGVLAAALGGSFTQGFTAAAESLGATVVWSSTFAPGSADFRAELRALKERSVELLFWDGEARDAETLVRQMAREKIQVGFCGGSELDPERHHAQTRGLFEGMVFVGEDWVPGAGSQAVLDSAVRAAGEERANRLHTRGYLAARLVASAVEGGALCPEELAAALATRVGTDPYLRSHGFLDWTPAEATLPVYTVTRGRAVAR